MMNTIYPNEGAQLHVNGAEAKLGTNMEGLLLYSRGVIFFKYSNLTARPGALVTIEGNVQGEKTQKINMAYHIFSERLIFPSRCTFTIALSGYPV